MNDKVCPNHPNVAAVTRCTSCFKPLCPECIVKREKKDFCSTNCATNFQRTNKSIEGFREKEKRHQFARLIKRIIIFILLLGVGAFVWNYWVNNKEEVEKTTNQLKEKVNKLKQDIDDNLKK